MSNDQSTPESLASFIARLGITMECARINTNPFTNDFGPAARHWTCTLVCEGLTFTTPFSQGSGHSKAPSAEDVLNCMASDSSSVENTGFEEWCSELGYDSDSLKAEKIYNACIDAACRLKDFLGAEAYQQLLWNTERL